MNKFILLAALTISMSVNAQNAQPALNIVPMPAEIKTAAGAFTINKNTNIVLEGSGLEKTAAYLNDYLNNIYGYKLAFNSRYTSPNSIVLNYERLDADIPGAYNLTVNKKGIYIAGDNDQAVFYGIQTLIQLLPTKNKIPLNIPFVTINDQPRFQYRGMMLDVSRHFLPLSIVKKYIDYLALHKLNTFHWHLTDDQGWRIEIKKYPRLTEIGGWRNGTIIGRYPGKGNDSTKHGGYYTQDEIKRVIKYAAERYVTIIPEIEMPGHSSAAIAAYPQLSCFPDEDTQFPKECVWAGPTKGKQVQQTWGVFEDVFCPSDYTFNFLQDVLDEVMALFPSDYIHIGGDECPKEAWKRSAFCQELMKKQGLKDEHALQSYFIQRIEKYINSKGKKIIGWDEILEGGLAPNATVMSWRGIQGGIDAARQKHTVIMTPGDPLYFNHSQTKNEDSVTQGGYNPLEYVYDYEPLPKELSASEAKYILGAQANVWSEYIGTQTKLEYSIFPRMAALSEILWTPKEKKDRKDFERRLPSIMQRYELWKANYSKAFLELKASTIPTEDFNGVLWKVESRSKEPILINFNNGESISTYSKPQIIKNNMMVYANTEKNKLSAQQQFYFNKATGKKITLTNQPSPSYPGDGAFTLVNGIQNKNGLLRASEFIAFSGEDCEATIDLGSPQEISKVTVHTLQQKESWIWPPAAVEIFGSADGKNFASLGLTDNFKKKESNTGTMTVNLVHPANTRYIKVLAKNRGPIPDNEPGDGKPAWLFVDEIEVE
jgi:hexosaminidase